MYLAPRFVAYASGPRYGSRDEIIGSTTPSLIAVAETYEWLKVLVNRIIPDDWTEITVHIYDNAERSEWSPEIAELHNTAFDYEWPF